MQLVENVDFHVDCVAVDLLQQIYDKSSKWTLNFTNAPIT